MRHLFYFAVATSFALSAEAWIGGVTTQKFIGHGWDTLRSTPEEAIAHADEFDRTGLDGITVCLWGNNSAGQSCHFTRIMTDPAWDYESLLPRLETLKQFKEHPGLKESFLMFWMAPTKRLGWNDDAAWDRFANNVGVLAKLGAAAGMKGYFIDGEDYPKTKQFTFKPDADNMEFAAACRLARKRGAEVFGKLFKEHPNATLLSFWFLSAVPGYAYQRDPVLRMKQDKDLWPSFVNGILDVMPEAATFVDGDETAYNYEADKKDFYVKAQIQRHTALGLVAKANRNKYASQLSIGFGVYLDKCKNQEDFAKFSRNLAQAAAVSTEYVWVYGEKHNWVGWNKLGDKTWEQVFPGISDLLFSIKDPEGFLATCKDDTPASKLNFWTWKEDKRKTEFKQEGDVWKAMNGPGSVLAGAPAKYGELFVASVLARGENATASVHWRRKGAFDWMKPEFPMYLGEPDANGWRRGKVLARVPYDVDELVIHCAVSGDDDAKAEFRDFSVRPAVSNR